MKIELELTRSEAHELNYIIMRGSKVTEVTRAGNRALNLWNDQYIVGMNK